MTDTKDNKGIFVIEMTIPEQWRNQPVEPIESIVAARVHGAVTVETKSNHAFVWVARGKVKAWICVYWAHPQSPVESLVVGARSATDSRSLAEEICSELERAGFRAVETQGH